MTQEFIDASQEAISISYLSTQRLGLKSQWGYVYGVTIIRHFAVEMMG
jgi:hypothetical protein